MPSKVGRFQIVDFENSKSNLVKDKGAIHAIKIMPMEINKGVIEITLVDFLISDEKGERILVNSGSQTFSYKYNSANKQYVLINKTRHSF
ncbi:hypothetical protein GWC95_12005 [Sediminibacterium roseum]|uniref:Uncharacterized protein n=1 Tax=Sediminibacterium roseum TaxID=1978412 RepID=A0ABW9ZY70_9BACT|nr:hypothetical protein [Sediminibacterium roseum]NCI50652.1 hypothetical protein [Sediminibacterium roseum]